MENTVYILTGPGGAGKDTLLSDLRHLCRGTHEFPVSHTTRPPRPGEVNGLAYHFVTGDAFYHTPMVESAKFGEFRYGLSVEELRARRSEGPCIVIMEASGSRAVPGPVVRVFVTAPGHQLVARMRARGDDDETISRRLDNDRSLYPFQADCDHVLTNPDGGYSRCLSDLVAIVRGRGPVGPVVMDDGYFRTQEAAILGFDDPVDLDAAIERHRGRG